MDNWNLPEELNSTHSHKRTIVHIDIDCFYAQVEMLKRPELRMQPIGVQQKNIVVTSNYVARESGIEKCMLVNDALKLCPDLVLVSGEDLYEYRKMSNKITALLQTFNPQVEKLGLDENFIDISQLVNERLDKKCRSETVIAEEHVYADNMGNCSCGCHKRLCVGSHIANEMRARLYSELNITSCAGISYNKLLAKLVCSTHKPNQQTTLFPCAVSALLENLGSIRNIPGIGHCMQNLLQSVTISTIQDLQNASLRSLQELVGNDTAIRIKKLSFGIDDSLVKVSGRPQTIGLEDGFQKIGVESEVREKFVILLQRLMKLLTEDGRIPGSVKITVRQYDNIAKHSHRESRQCNIAPSLFSPGSDPGQLKGPSQEKIISSIMQLFHKIVNIQKPFHLTLLGIAFTKFQERSTGRSSIASFLQKDVSVQSVTDFKILPSDLKEASSSVSISAIRVTSSRFSTDKSGSESEVEPSPKKTRRHLWVNPRKRLADEMDQDSPSKLRVSELRLSSPRLAREDIRNVSEPSASIANNEDQLQCPGDADPTVFQELPRDVQEELLGEWRRKVKIANKAKHVAGSQGTLLKYFIHKNSLS